MHYLKKYFFLNFISYLLDFVIYFSYFFWAPIKEDLFLSSINIKQLKILEDQDQFKRIIILRGPIILGVSKFFCYKKG